MDASSENRPPVSDARSATSFVESSPASASTCNASLSPQTTGKPKSSDRLHSVDFLRGVAAIAVVLCHCASAHSNALQMGSRAQYAWFNALTYVLSYGNQGVPLFFVISGFCIHLRWARQMAQDGAAKLDFWMFWKRRLWRLYPPYFIALCLSMTLAWLQWRATGSTLTTLNSTRGMMWDFALHVPMLHGLHPSFDEMGGNVPFWTLAREEYFYLAYFPLLWLRQKLGLKHTLICVGLLGMIVPTLNDFFWRSVSGGAEWWKIAAYPFNGENSALVLWLQWCLGLAAIEMHLGLVRSPIWSRNASLALLFGALGIAAKIFIAWHFVSIVLMGLAFWVLINACAYAETQGNWRVNNRIVRWFTLVGGFSYSLYLVHSPLLVPWRKLELVVLDKLGLSQLEAIPAFIILEWLLSAAFCYMGGRIFFFLVERWFLPGAFPPGKARTKTTIG